MINIKGMDKGKVLAALYNSAKVQGLGYLQYDPKVMTAEDANEIIENGRYSFDYLKGRVMKVNLQGDSFDPWGYDRDNGQGAAKRAIDGI